MDNNEGFVNLLNNQSPFDLHSPENAWFNTQSPETSSVKERRKWTPTEDRILIGAWLNTSKDPVIGNQQKAVAFWKRILDCYNSSPHLAGTAFRELGQIKQRWARINEVVGKFVACYDTALRKQGSGENDDTLMTAALDIFFTDYRVKFNLEHAWRELRHEKKWCSTIVAKDSAKEKRKQVIDVDVEAEGRPIGVKAAKAAAKRKKSPREEELFKLQAIYEMKETISKQKLLERLLAKKEPLTEIEIALKLKLMTQMI